MSVDWLNFKSCLGGSRNTSVFYIDNEGSEIPIESECEFQEAIRLAKLNNKRLKLILYCDKLKAHDTALEKQCEVSDNMLLDASHKNNTVKTAAISQESDVLEEKKCHCNGNVPPEWFTHYIKKFRKEILHELKSSLSDVIHSGMEKEKKMSKVKDSTDLSYGKSECTLTSASYQSKKKKKGSEKDLGDLLDQRDVKLAKKIEKRYPTKFERLEKLDNKTRVLLEEKRKLLERKRYSKPRCEKNYGIISEKEVLKKSASFCKKEVCIFLPPNAEFVVTLNFTNDGILRWEAPWLECFDFNGLYPKEIKISLPRLLPMESGFTTLRGRVSDSRGLHHFKCRLFDGLEKFGPEFTCWAKVEVNNPVKKLPNAMVSSQESDERKNEDSVGILIDFERDEVTATQKKIAENINDIERRLHDIDLLKPLSTADGNMRQSVADMKMAEEFRSSGCDLFQNFEGKEKNWKEKLEQEGVHFGVDCLRLTTPNNNKKTSRQKDENGRTEKLEKQQNSSGAESSSDSELSVIFLSEEEENFIVVPLPSKSPSPAESVNEGKKFGKTSSEEGAESVEQEPLKSHDNEVSENNKEVLNGQWQFGHTKNRLPPFTEDVSKSKPKKIKPSSTQYNFTAANLIQPTFTQIPEGIFEGRYAKFTFTGEKEEQKCSADCTLERGQTKCTTPEEKVEKKSTPDCLFDGRCSKHISSEEKDEKSFSSEDKQGNTSLAEGEFEGLCSRHTLLKDRKYKTSERSDIRNQKRSKCTSARRPSKSTPTENEERSEKKEVFKGSKVANKKLIYAVNSRGCCVPVDDLLEGHYRSSKTYERRREAHRSQRGEKRYDRFNEVSAVPVLPTSLINGASNVAAFAFNTAKTVINNLHSVLATEWKTELGKFACENRGEISKEAMTRLFDMGFENAELNKMLLLTHENNLAKVVEVLLQMENNLPQRYP